MAKVHIYTIKDIEVNCRRVISEIEKYNEIKREKHIQDLMNTRRIYFLWMKLDRKRAEEYTDTFMSTYHYYYAYSHACCMAEDLLEIVTSDQCKDVVLTTEEFNTIFNRTYYKEEK
jgi:hypothetical protein